MDADQAHYDRLVEIATLAHQHCVALNLACAVRGLYSAELPTADEKSRVAQATMAAAAADEALVKWRERHAGD